MSGARVVLGNDHVAITDEKGHYQLLNVTTGTYTLKVSQKVSVLCLLIFILMVECFIPLW